MVSNRNGGHHRAVSYTQKKDWLVERLRQALDAFHEVLDRHADAARDRLHAVVRQIQESLDEIAVDEVPLLHRLAFVREGTPLQPHQNRDRQRSEEEARRRTAYIFVIEAADTLDDLTDLLLEPQEELVLILSTM